MDLRILADELSHHVDWNPRRFDYTVRARRKYLNVFQKRLRWPNPERIAPDTVLSQYLARVHCVDAERTMGVRSHLLDVTIYDNDVSEFAVWIMVVHELRAYAFPN